MSRLPTSLDSLLHARTIEGHRREFKATWNDAIRPAVVRSVCAFANDLQNLNGGYVILGVEEDDTGRPILPPVGLGDLDLDRVQREIFGAIRQGMSPEYQPVMFVEHVGDRPILVLWAPAGETRPYEASKRDRSGTAYCVRVGSQTVDAAGDLLRQLLEQSAQTPFDDRRNLEARTEDLSPALVARYLADVGSSLAEETVGIGETERLQALRLLARVNDHSVPRNVALLFFHEDPCRYFAGAHVVIARFADDAGGDLIEEVDIRGPLAEQARRALAHLASETPFLVRKVAAQAESETVTPYPLEAVEEALVNALYHRSYEPEWGEPTKVYLYPDRMEIISYPGPVAGLGADDLRSTRLAAPAPARNRRIGEFLKDLRLAEQRGTGIPRIRARMAANGSPEPRFDFDEARTWFRATLPVHPEWFVTQAIRTASFLWAGGARTDAIAHLTRAARLRPESGAIAALLIEYTGRTGSLDGARAAFEAYTAAAAPVNDCAAHVALAEELVQHGEEAEARQVLQSLPCPPGPALAARVASLRARLEAHH